MTDQADGADQPPYPEATLLWQYVLFFHPAEKSGRNLRGQLTCRRATRLYRWAYPANKNNWPKPKWKMNLGFGQSDNQKIDWCRL
jgi:hypothetical protein